jgi:hypothetical protein
MRPDLLLVAFRWTLVRHDPYAPVDLSKVQMKAVVSKSEIGSIREMGALLSMSQCAHGGKRDQEL